MYQVSCFYQKVHKTACFQGLEALLYPKLVQYSSSICLNSETVDAEITATGRELT